MTPPFRLQSITQINAFRRYTTPDYFPESMLSFARSNPLVIPPLLNKIPLSLDVTIKTVEKTHEALISSIPHFLDDDRPFRLFEQLRAEFLDVTDELPENYDDLVTLICKTGIALLEGIKPKSAHRFSDTCGRIREKSEIIGKLERRTLAIDLMGEIFQIFLSTSNDEVGLFLKKTIIALISYDTQTSTFEEELWERIEAYEVPCIGLIREFMHLYCKKLSVLKSLFLHPSVVTFIQHFKDKIIKQRLPANLRRSVIDQMNTLYRDTSISKVKNNINKIIGLYEHVAADGELLRAKGILQNFLFLLDKYENFFEANFYCSQINVFHSLIHTFKKKKLDRNDIAENKKLTLYPCKDYHDYLKGYYSHDCTVDEDLAKDHLANPRFFNIRIFYSDEWVGNIYVLDYSCDREIVLIDRIQIKKSFTFMPIRFFSTFMEKFTGLLLPHGSRIKIIAPHNISNFPHISNSFRKYSEQCEKIAFNCDKTEEAFESYDEEIFYVLHPRPADA
ncbi:MAG: hypothetical protein JW881_09170 [Spirochaetales bacterium]|nr:hypothetical protein [Spirochaetales bacterium]